MILTTRPSKSRGSVFGSHHTHNNIPQPHHHPRRGLPGRLDKPLGQILSSPYTSIHTIRRPTTPNLHPGTPPITRDMHRPLPNIRPAQHSPTKHGYTDHTSRIPRPQRRQNDLTTTTTTITPPLHYRPNMRDRPTKTHPVSIPNPKTVASPMVGGNERSNTTTHRPTTTRTR